jgi:hypothetical protein
MTDLSTAAANALTSLNNSTEGGFVEEYEIRPGGSRRVKRGNPLDQVKAALILQGLSNRSSNGLMSLAKVRTDRQ